MRTFHSFPFLVFGLLSLNTVSHAQELVQDADDKQTTLSRYVIGEDSKLLMPVNILGAVEKSGHYLVPSETDLLALLAFAGGLRDDAKLNDVKIVRRISSQKAPQTTKIDLKKLYAADDDALPPKLMPDDLVIIGKKNVVTSQVIAEIARSVAFAAQTIYIVYLISKD